MHNLKEMFEELRKNKLSCNTSKCEYAFNEIDYLGYKISADGIKISDDKIKIIQKIQPPKDKRSLQRLLGLFNYHRRHIPDYRQKTFNMRQLLVKDMPFLWNQACQDELLYLKNCLILFGNLKLLVYYFATMLQYMNVQLSSLG